MSIVIEELVAEVRPDPAAGDETVARPAEGRSGDTLLELLALAAEREARLAVD